MKKGNIITMGSILLILALPFLLSPIVYGSSSTIETLSLGATVAYQSRIGIQLKNVLNMNADLLNKAGGLTIGGKTYKVEYHIYDDKYEADAGRAAIERLVFQDKIKFNVGTFGSAPTLAMLGVTEPNKIPIFGGAASEKLLAPDVKYFVHTYPAKFYLSASKAILEMRPDVKNIVMCTYDDETGHTIVPPMEKAYKVFGVENLHALYYKHGEKDFTPIATKVVSLKADYFKMFGVMVASEFVQVIKALREAGYKGVIEGQYISQETANEIVSKVGLKGAEGIYVGIFDPTFSGLKTISKEASDFREKYEKYYGKWETEGLQWAGCWYTWLAAVKKANSLDPEKVLSAIDKDLRISTPLGPVKLFRRPDLGNERYRDYAVGLAGGIIKDGKIIQLYERDADYMIDVIEKVYGVKMR